MARKVKTEGSFDSSQVNDTNNTDAGISATNDMEASGAIIEGGAKDMVDFDHPAVDNNPRKGTTKAQNLIEFNDPDLTESEAVAKALEGTGADAPAAEEPKE